MPDQLTPALLDLDVRIGKLEAQVVILRQTLGSALTWIAQSAASPLSIEDVRTLLKRLDEGVND